MNDDEKKIDVLKAALIAAEEDLMACHSIAVWEQIKAAIAAVS